MYFILRVYFYRFYRYAIQRKKAPGYSDCSRDSYSSTFWKIDRERLQWSPFLSIYYLQLYKFYLKLSLIGWPNFFGSTIDVCEGNFLGRKLWFVRNVYLPQSIYQEFSENAFCCLTETQNVFWIFQLLF